MHVTFEKIAKMVFAIGMMALALTLTLSMFAPGISDAAVYIGGEEIQGYEPQDIVTTDTQLSDPNEAADKMEEAVVKLIRVAMPFVMLGCVAIIVFNAVANIFRPKEKKVPMGELIKNMFVQFFFILFAFLIVEGIVFVVTGGQTILFATIMS